MIGPPVRRSAPVMGTVASIHVHDDAPPDLVHAAIDEALAELERLEAMFSTYRADSVVSAINRGERNVLDGPAEVIDVLDACTWLEQVTGGAFRARRPEPPFPIDPAGFVKGWATERASAALERAGLRRWCFSVGGDLIARGRSRSEPALADRGRRPFAPGRGGGVDRAQRRARSPPPGRASAAITSGTVAAPARPPSWPR